MSGVERIKAALAKLSQFAENVEEDSIDIPIVADELENLVEDLGLE